MIATNLLLSKIHSCRKCSLHKNQPPLLDDRSSADVIWVGLSAVRVADVYADIPLSTSSRSGSLLSHVEAFDLGIRYYRTNLVKCLPLQKGRIRYPTGAEMSSCYENLRLEIEALKPATVFLLGKMVTECITSSEQHPPHRLDPDFKYGHR